MLLLMDLPLKKYSIVGEKVTEKKKWWVPILNRALDFVFTSFCPICDGQVFKDGYSYVCQECLDLLFWVRDTRCKFCGIPMSGMDFQGLTCKSCREENILFDEGRCLFVIEERSKNLIHDIKYHGARMILRDVPSWIDRSPGFREYLEGKVLVPVPLHRSRLRSRGFNQSEWIAKAFRKAIDPNIQVINALKRTKNTPSQTELDRTQRKENMKNAFALKRKNHLKQEDEIMLIDDVFTTGATLNACTEVLREGGFNRISIATLGHG